MNAICLHRSTDESSLCVVSPEVLFLEMAAQLSGIELVKLGYELCGVYSLPMSQPNYAGTPRGYSRRKALTSVARLTAHVASQSNNRSVKKARWALRYVLDGSASPRETELSMLMVLPRKWAGMVLGSRKFGMNLPPRAKCCCFYRERILPLICIGPMLGCC